MPLPALANGFITIGCFQHLSRVTDEVLELWGRIFAQLPTARIRFQSPQLKDSQFVEEFHLRLASCGIDSNRISTHGASIREEYLAAHSEIDLILDTFPYTGGTKTCEALWMGVPTLTLAGETLLARQGASLLSAAGLNDWVVNDKETYFTKAVHFANDIPALANLRQNLREQVLISPIFNSKRFAENFENTLWKMWRD